ncbi:MAG: RidA family protein, partial [Dehalococcoidia bacterium]
VCRVWPRRNERHRCHGSSSTLWFVPPAVVNGCSDLLVELYGDRGRHARSAVGLATLPGGVAVEIEMIAEVSG